MDSELVSTAFEAGQIEIVILLMLPSSTRVCYVRGARRTCCRTALTASRVRATWSQTQRRSAGSEVCESGTGSLLCDWREASAAGTALLQQSTTTAASSPPQSTEASEPL
jgi:hypothetical protein